MAPESRFPGRMPHRATDLAEDLIVWLLAAVGLIVVVVALFAGTSAHAQLHERGQQERTNRVQVDAVVMEDAPIMVDGAGAAVRPLAPIQWTDPWGRLRSASAGVPPAAEAGDHIRVWIDRGTGDPKLEPVGEDAAIAAGLLAAIAVLLAGCGCILGFWALVRRATTARNHARWEREWAQLGPEWSNHT